MLREFRFCTFSKYGTLPQRRVMLSAESVLKESKITLENFISSHENEKVLSPFYQKIFLRENKYKILIGCLTFIFYQ